MSPRRSSHAGAELPGAEGQGDHGRRDRRRRQDLEQVWQHPDGSAVAFDAEVQDALGQRLLFGDPNFLPPSVMVAYLVGAACSLDRRRVANIAFDERSPPDKVAVP
jgi:hypothetical protein